MIKKISKTLNDLNKTPEQKQFDELERMIGAFAEECIPEDPDYDGHDLDSAIYRRLHKLIENLEGQLKSINLIAPVGKQIYFVKRYLGNLALDIARFDNPPTQSLITELHHNILSLKSVSGELRDIISNERTRLKKDFILNAQAKYDAAQTIMALNGFCARVQSHFGDFKTGVIKHDTLDAHRLEPPTNST